MNLPRRSFRTAAGWSFARTKQAILPAWLRLAKCALGSFDQNDRWVRFAKTRGAPRPHAEEHRSATQAQVLSAADARCDASRSMRAHALARPHPSRRAYARSSLRDRSSPRAPQDEDGRARGELRLVPEPLAVIPFHDVKQPISFPRRICVRGLRLCFTHPERGVGGAPRNVRVQRHPLGVP